MEQAIEVYSVEFDKQYIDEEEILRRHDPFLIQQPEALFLPLKKAGDEFWPSIRSADEKKRALEANKKRLKEIDEKLEHLGEEEEHAEEKENLKKERDTIEQQILAEEAEASIVKKVPLKVKDSDKLNIILIGPN